MALVTGGAQGLGRAIAERLGELGALTVVADLSEEGAERAAEEMRSRGLRAEHRQLDVTDRASVQAAMGQVAERHGGLDILVNNAGILRDNWLVRMTEDEWDAVLRTNLKGAFLCSQAAAPIMMEKKFGRIINISSRSWLGNPGQVNYSSAKGGLVSMTRTLALELGKFGVTVNCVAPGLIDTPLTQKLPAEVRERLIQAQPGRNIGQPSDVAYAVAFFADDSANFITGQILHVCGGKSVKADW